MPIYKDDIKLFASKNMTDTSDGGGEMSGVEIVSGEHNSIFPDVSDLDRAYGRVGIRSVHMAVKSALADTYFGATVGVLKQPDDPNVSITLMSQNSPYVMRDESRSVIESYLARGVKFQCELFYDQIKGSRAIRMVQRSAIKLPVAGEVLILLNKTTSSEQYVKITKVESALQTFTHTDNSEFSRRVVTCEISEPLRFSLVGVVPSPYDPISATSAVYESMVADASKYYSVKKLATDAAFGASAVTVSSVYNQLVPSARIDSAHINLRPVDVADVAIKCSANGQYTVTAPVNLESQMFTISKENQGYVYTQTLVPTPALGTVIVSYMVQGKWYVLKDAGTGVLAGVDESHGTGLIDVLGNINLTLGALPDVNSPILYQWGNTNIATKLVTAISSSAKFDVQLPSTPLPDAMTINWGSKSATVTGGVISGDATGTVRGRAVSISPNELSAPLTEYNFSWTKSGVARSHAVSVVKSASLNFVFDASGTADEVMPNSVVISMPVQVTGYLVTDGRENFQDSVITVAIRDDGNGNLVHNGAIVGSVNYVLRECAIAEGFNIQAIAVAWEQARLSSTGSPVWKRKSVTIVNAASSFANHGATVAFNAAYTLADDINNDAGTHSVTPDAITVDVETSRMTLLGSSLRFTLAGNTYTSTGTALYIDDTVAGSIDLLSGSCVLSNWSAGSKEVGLLSGLLKTTLPDKTNDFAFITAGNPVASQSLQVNALSFTGNINCVADADGNITGNGFTGKINYQLGVVELTNTTQVDSDSIRYNCVSYNYLPLDAAQLGLDAIRLPSDGRVVIYRKGDVSVIHQDESITRTVTNGETVNLPHVRLSELTVTGATYTADLDAGTVTFTSAGDVVIEYRFEDMFLVTGVDISGLLKTSRPLSHAYSASKAFVASVLIAGDLFARYTNLFDQTTWTSVWSDSLIGTEPTAEYNDTIYPLIMRNDGAITERFAIVFTSSTNFKLIGEHIGEIAVGDINTNFSPINPTGGQPYFTLNKLGWGAGWSTGNVLRFNSIGAVYQLNVIRTILQGESLNPVETDTFALQLRGNINKEVI